MAVTLSAMGVGFGALFPRFEMENVAQIQTSPGGLLFMVTALFYVGVTLALEAVLMRGHYFSGRGLIRSDESLYAMAADERGYVAEHFKERLPKASIGKACVRFKRLADLDLAALRDLVRETVEIGLPGVDGPAPPSTRKSTATKPTSKTKPASSLATKSAAASPAEPTKSSTGKLAAKPSASSKSAPKPPAKSSAKSSAKPPAKSSSKPPAKSSAKPPAKPAKSSAKPPAKPAKVSPTSSAAQKLREEDEMRMRQIVQQQQEVSNKTL